MDTFGCHGFGIYPPSPDVMNEKPMRKTNDSIYHPQNILGCRTCILVYICHIVIVIIKQMPKRFSRDKLLPAIFHNL